MGVYGGPGEPSSHGCLCGSLWWSRRTQQSWVPMWESMVVYGSLWSLWEPWQWGVGECWYEMDRNDYISRARAEAWQPLVHFKATRETLMVTNWDTAQEWEEPAERSLQRTSKEQWWINKRASISVLSCNDHRSLEGFKNAAILPQAPAVHAIVPQTRESPTKLLAPNSFSPEPFRSFHPSWFYDYLVNVWISR